MNNDISPNTNNSAVAEPSAVATSDASIAAKMSAMRENTVRNQLRATEQPAAGVDSEESSPVAPEGSDAEPEVAYPSDNDVESDHSDADTQETVSADDQNTVADELIDFLEFADTNPNAKFKFMRNGKEVVIDAKKAASILGQGSAIHEEARQLKVERAEFDEYLNDTRARQEGLTLAMEFTVQPKLQGAYDEIVKTQGYQSTFQQQLARTNDPATRARIQASMQQNEQYIRSMQNTIGDLQPAVDQFRAVRANQVTERLDGARKNFKDKDLRNEYVYNEIRDKVSKVWPDAKGELIPGVTNIDLISSDENLLSLVRDGLKYRDKPTAKSAGSSMAALTQRRGSSTNGKGSNDNIEKLREQAKAGDKKAGDNLLVAQLQKIRSARGGR